MIKKMEQYGKKSRTMAQKTSFLWTMVTINKKLY